MAGGGLGFVQADGFPLRHDSQRVLRSLYGRAIVMMMVVAPPPPPPPPRGAMSVGNCNGGTISKAHMHMLYKCM